MKKNILFVMPSMFIGGAERSLIGLLNGIDYDRYNVSLFLYRHEGEFLSYIPSKVRLLKPIKEYETFDVPIKTLFKNGQIRFGIARVMAKILMKIHCIKSKEVDGVWMAMQYISKSLLPLLPEIPGEYDAGISFLGVPDVLLHRVNAKTKFAWNHTDYTTLYPDKKRDIKLYNGIDYIVSVSRSCTSQFLKVYPEFKEKAITIENILDVKTLERESNLVVSDMSKRENNKILLSVGRYSRAKNFDNIPAICRMIREKGIDVIWYIIGYGTDESIIKEQIIKEGMQEYVILLGKKNNPYSYIKSCDLYVQPSRYEGKAVTVREAQALHKPVVITKFETSSEQLIDGYDGMIVPMDNEGCAEGIASLLKDGEKLSYLVDNTYQMDYSNKQEIQKLYRLIK